MVVWYLAMLYAAIASYVIGGLIATFPDDVAPDDSDPFQNPQSAPTYPVPLVFGTRRIRGVNTLWYGNVRSEAIKKKVKAGWKSKKITIGYRYFLSIHLGIAYGFPDMSFNKFYISEDIIYDDAVSGVIWTGGFNTFNKQWLYGGEEQGGGVAGSIRFYDGVGSVGNPLEIQPILYTSIGQDDQIPHYKNLAQIMLSSMADSRTTAYGMYIGTAKQVRPFSVVVSNVRYNGSSGAPYTNGVDVNPVTVLRHLLVGDDRFLKLTGDEVDLLTLSDVEQVVWDEGILCSPIYSQTKSVEKMIETILKLIDAVFYTDPLTGLLTLTLMRELTPTGNEITINSSNLVKVIKTKQPERSSVVNEVKLTYTDREHNYESRTITAQDLAGFIQAGQIHNTKTVDYSSICTIGVARQICDRDLMQLSKPVTSFDLEVNRVLANSRIGDQVIVDLPDVGGNGEYYRIASIDYGNLEKGSIKVSLISDVYTGHIAVYSQEDGSAFVDPIGVNNATEITDAIFVELPRILLRRYVDVNPTEGLDTDWGFFIIAPNSNSYHVTYDVYVDEYISGSYELVTSDNSFVPTATLVEDFDRFDPWGSFFIDSTHRIKFSAPSADLEELLVTVLDAQNSEEPARYIYMGGEWMMYTSVEDLGGGVYSFNNLRRGALGSPPRDHVIDDIIYFISDIESLYSDTGIIRADSSSVKIKLNPKGMAGDVGVENVVGSDTVISLNKALLPIPATYLKFNDIFYRDILNKVYGQSVTIDWRHTNVNDFDGNWVQNNEDALEATVSYTIQVYEADGITLIRTVTDNVTQSYIYTKEMEIVDHGTNDSELKFKITTVDSVNGSCVEPRFESVQYGGYGLDYGNDYGR